MGTAMRNAQANGRRARFRSIAVTAVAAVVILAGCDLLGSDPDRTGPDGTSAEYDYDDAIREQVLVPFGLDLDGNGVDDHVSLDIIRPNAPEGTQLPVIVIPSPYFAETGRGPERETRVLDDDGLAQQLPLFFDNHFVPRGYAVAVMDTPGTGRSTGCLDHMGPSDIGGAAAAVQYLAGAATGSTPDGRHVTADWSNGKVGMSGKSYDGAVVNGVAALGTPGLAAVITEAALSDVYEYARPGSIVRYPNYQSEIASLNQTREQSQACAEFMAQMQSDSDDATGSRNAFWQDRAILDDLSQWQAPTLITHGLADWNVLPQHGTDLYEALVEQGVPVQLWLSQAGHEAMFDVRREAFIEMAELWFDHWLLEQDNGVMDRDAVLVQSNLDLSEWSEQAGWPLPATEARYVLSSTGQQGVLSPEGSGGMSADDEITFRYGVDTPLVPTVPPRHREQQLLFVTEELEAPVSLSGRPVVTVRIGIENVDRAMLGVQLIDWGRAERVDQSAGDGGVLLSVSERDCVGPEPGTQASEGEMLAAGCYLTGSLLTTESDYGVLSRSWLDLEHRGSREQPEPIEPGTAYDLALVMSPVQAQVPSGHRLGLVVFATDHTFTIDYAEPCIQTELACDIPSVDRDAEYTLYLGGSELALPVVTQ